MHCVRASRNTSTINVSSRSLMSLSISARAMLRPRVFVRLPRSSTLASLSLTARVAPLAAGLTSRRTSSSPELRRSCPWRAIVNGSYFHPPNKAMVLWVDKRGRIYALDRTQPSVPMSFTAAQPRRYYYRRHNIIGLFIALNVAVGQVTGTLKRAVIARTTIRRLWVLSTRWCRKGKECA